MTSEIGTHGLSCISDTDFAAYALAMQCNAQATDAALAAATTSLNTYLDRPSILITNTATITVGASAGGGTVGPEGTIGSLLDSDSPPTNTVTANGLPTVYNGSPSTLWPAGIYLIGASVNWTLAASTAASIRKLLVFGEDDIAGTVSPTVTYRDLYYDVDYQGDGGLNGALTVVGFLQSTGRMAMLASMFAHDNVAGNLSIAAGQWRCWATYLGSGLAV